MKRFNPVITLMVGCLALTACDTGELDYPFNKTAAVNYYQVSEVIYEGGAPLIGVVMDGRGEANLNERFPEVAYLNANKDQVSFPYSSGINLGVNPQQPLYTSYPAGEHTFLYTTTYSDLLETNHALEVNQRYCFYLADVPAAVNGDRAAFTVVVSRQPREQAIEPGKVAVRVIHFSPDAGPVNVKLQTRDNTERTAGLPQQLVYGQVPEYVLLDTSEVQNGLLALNIRDAQSGALQLVAAVPASTGHSFEVLLHGFTAPASRQLMRGDQDENGNQQYTLVNIAPNLRATVRQTF